MDREVIEPTVVQVGSEGLGVARGPAAVAGVGVDARRGSEARKARDAIFRRMLFVADAVAILGAFVLALELSSRAVHLTWATVAGVAIMLVGAKVFGLYDRDEVLLRRTTLDEAPKLFQMATMCALVAWLTGGLVVAGRLDRRETLFIWIALFAFFAIARTVARAAALRAAPVERCLFIGDAAGAKAMAGKLNERRGVRAELVGHIELDTIDAWSSTAHGSPQLTRVRELARSLDVHRAIVAPSTAGADEVLNLLRTLNAAGVPVSILPRLLEVVGSSVEFDDVHGVTLMGVRRFELTRSSLAVKRTFDVFCAWLGLIAVAPLMLIIAIAVKLDSRGPVFFRQQRVGRYGTHFWILKFRTMVADAESIKDSLRESNEADGGLFKIAEDPRITRVGRILRKTALDELPRAAEHHQRRDEHGRPSSARRRRGRARAGLASPAPRAHARHDRPVADPRPRPGAAGRDGHDRLPVRRQLVALERHQDPAAHRDARDGKAWPVNPATSDRADTCDVLAGTALLASREMTSKRTSRAIQLAQGGDREALGYLYVRYSDDIHGYVRSIVRDTHEAEDITQQVFAKLMHVIGKYEPRDVPFLAWILRVARNLTVDHLRRQRATPVEEVRTNDHGRGDPAASRTARDLKEALETLPDDQREVLVLRHLAGLSPTEIADHTGRTESSIHGLHHRGRRALRAELTSRGAAPAIASIAADSRRAG